MQTSNKSINRDQLQEAYIESIIDGMDLKDCLAVLHDYMTDSYKDYTIEEIKEEVNEYYPHLLRDEE